MSKFNITEEQYKMLVDEGIEIKADLAAADGNVQKAVDTANQEASQQGVKDYTISIPGKNSENCSKIITKKQIKESRLRSLEKNSVVYSIKDFLKK